MEHQAALKKGNTSLLYIVIAVVVVIGGIFWYSNQKSTIAPTKEDATKIEESSPNDEVEDKAATSPGAMEDEDTDVDVKVVNVKGSPFKFAPNEIRVKKGEKVRIVFTNENGTHDWVIDEFNVRTKIINGGETESVEFTADKVGTFEYYCSVGNHRAQGMKGNLIVE